jgi:hypothetical protein
VAAVYAEHMLEVAAAEAIRLRLACVMSEAIAFGEDESEIRKLLKKLRLRLPSSIA